MRILGWLAMALAVVGIIGGVLFAAGIWVVKPAIQAPIDNLVASADGGLEKAMTLTGAVSSKLTVVEGRIGELKAKADALAAGPVFDGPLATSLSTAINEFVTGPYASMRADYIALRERAMDVGDQLRALDSAIPAVALPGVATERLQALDARLSEFDSTVTQIATEGVSSLVDLGIAERISERIGTAQANVANLNSMVADVDARLQASRDRLAAASTTVSNALTLGAIGTTVFGIWFAALNVLLFQQGRRWTRPKAKTEPAPES